MNDRKFLKCLDLQNQHIVKQAESGQLYCYTLDKTRHFFNLVI